MTQCQSNSIVLLSDGAPTRDTSYQDVFRQTGTNTNIFGKDLGCDSNCAIEMASELYNTDNDSTADNYLDRIKTFTVGFNTSDSANDVLRSIAAAGQPTEAGVSDPRFQTADTSSELLQVLRSFVTETIDIDGDVFSAPAVTVNAYNRLQNREDIYYALFRPVPSPRWDGNVKKYKVSANAEILDNSSPPKSAINADGFFDETSKRNKRKRKLVKSRRQPPRNQKSHVTNACKKKWPRPKP